MRMRSPAKAQKIPFHGVQHRPDGASQIFLQDPDGHWIELTSDLPGKYGDDASSVAGGTQASGKGPLASAGN